MGTLTRVASRSGIAALILLAGLTCGKAFAGWSESVTGGTGLALSNSRPATPSAPTAVCTSTTGTTIRVTFTAVSFATSYSIYESNTVNGTYVAMATGVTSSPYTTPTLLLGTYYFEIQAVEGSGWATSNSSPSGGHTIGVTGCS